jgi:hypothetical protein
MVVGMTAKAETALPFQRWPFNSCKSQISPHTTISHVWGPAQKQIAFGRFHKDPFSPLRELSKCGEGQAFSAVRAWDVFCMLEQFKKDFVFKLGICEALDGDQGL